MDKFKKGDYIVVLEKPNGKKNYVAPYHVFVQREDNNCLYVEKGFDGEGCACWDIGFEDKDKTWRYANSQEIIEYDRLKKPFDIRTLVFKEFVLPQNWKVKINQKTLTPRELEIIRNWREDGKLVSGTVGWFRSNSATRGYYFVNEPLNDFFTTYTEITVEQFFKYVLKQELGFKDLQPGSTAVSLGKSYTYKVVHCKTQGEWDFVNSKLIDKYKNSRDYFPNICKNLNSYSYCDLDWYKKENCKILSFEDWCKENDYIFPEVEKLKFEKGKWYLYKHPSTNYFFKCGKKSSDSEIWVSEYINLEEKKHSRYEDVRPFKDPNVTDIEVFLDEIQQFLPENHPDKFNSECENCNGTGEVMEGKLYPNGHTEVNVECPECKGLGEIDFPEYVECIKEILYSNIELSILKGDILKTYNNDKVYGFYREDNSKDCYNSLETFYKHFKPSTKEAFDKQNSKEQISNKIMSDEEWIPQVGEYAVMENAGGWSYSNQNNGCIAIIEKVNPNREAFKLKTYGISGKVLNPRIDDYANFENVPIKSHYSSPRIICRKATEEEIASIVKKDEVWIPEIGDWVVTTQNQCNWEVGTLVKVVSITSYLNPKSGLYSIEAKSRYKDYTLKTSCYRKALPREIAEEEPKMQEARRSSALGKEEINTISVGLDDLRITTDISDKGFWALPPGHAQKMEYMRTGYLSVNDYTDYLKQYPVTYNQSYEPETSTNHKMAKVEPIKLPKLKKLN